MDISLVEQLVKQQVDFDLDHVPRFKTTDAGIDSVTKTFLDLRHEIFLDSRQRSLERIRQQSLELAALSIKFVVELT